jgi:hypothetical protein
MENKNEEQVKVENKITNSIFKDIKSIELNPTNFMQTVRELDKKMNKVMEEDYKDKEESVKGHEFKPEHLMNIANGVTNDMGYLLVLSDEWENAFKRGSRKIEEVNTFKIELCKLFHSISVKLRMASIFGFGETESPIGIVHTDKLPTAEESKKMSKEKLRKVIDNATDMTGQVDNTSTRTFKK